VTLSLAVFEAAIWVQCIYALFTSTITSSRQTRSAALNCYQTNSVLETTEIFFSSA